MGVKYVKDFAFPSDRGFHGSNKMPRAAMASERGMPRVVRRPMPLTPVPEEPMYGKGGKVTKVPAKAKESYKDVPARAKPNAPARGAPKMESKPKVGKGQGYAEGGYVPGYEMDRLPAKKPPGRGMDLAPSKRFKGEYEGYAKGGKVKGEKIAKVMREYKEGKLHSGSKKGPVVKNPKQAMAIALSEARAAKKAKGGEIFSDEYMAYESKGPKTRYTAAKGRRMAKERAMERRALDKARHAEKYAPGLSLDMEDESTVPTYQSLKPRKKVEMLKYAKGGKAKHSDVKMDKAMVKKAVHKHEKAMHPGKKMTKLNKGGVPSYGRKAMYGGGKC